MIQIDLTKITFNIFGELVFFNIRTNYLNEEITLSFKIKKNLISYTGSNNTKLISRVTFLNILKKFSLIKDGDYYITPPIFDNNIKAKYIKLLKYNKTK